LRYIESVYETFVTKTSLDSDGRVKERASWKQDIVPVDGVPFFVLLEENGAPIDPAREADQQRRNQQRFMDLQRRSAHQKAEDREAFEKRREERNRFWDDFRRAFHFDVVSQSRHNDRTATIVRFRPDPSYRPHGVIDTEYLPNIAGQIWIDQQDVELARLEIEFIKDLRIGFGIVGSIRKGTTYSMELSKQIDGLWLPRRAETGWRIRKLVAGSHERFVVDLGNYRRFSVDATWMVK
jgi:hypothetical protein